MPLINNFDAELSILGNFLLKQENLEIFNKLDEKYFFSQSTKHLFREIKKCLDNDLEINMFNVKVDSNDFMSAVSKASMATVESTFNILLEDFMAREAQSLGTNLATYVKTSNETQAIVKHMKFLLEEYDGKQSIKKTNSHISVILPKLFDEIKKDGYSYNFNVLGLQEFNTKPGHLVCIVARPKSGKTSFLTQLTIDCLKKNKSVLFCSLEVNEIEIGTKILACQANVNPLAVSHYGEPDQSENNTGLIIQGIKELEDKPLEIYKTAECYIAELKSVIVEFCKTHESPIIVLDQLQFIKSGRKFDKKHEEYDYIMQEIKIIASKTNSTIFVAHQLNRDIEKRDGKFPQPSDIKDCGRIEEICDLGIMFAKSGGDADTNRYATIFSRNMDSGQVVLGWNRKKARFDQQGD